MFDIGDAVADKRAIVSVDKPRKSVTTHRTGEARGHVVSDEHGRLDELVGTGRSGDGCVKEAKISPCNIYDADVRDLEKIYKAGAGEELA